MEVERENEQELEWNEAQNIEIMVDLAAAARKQLKFLAAVDRNRSLYEGPALLKAIYRYKACWLPLLAKYSDFENLEGPLVVPLDCEWIWHCHRLNPLRYKSDCEEFYGRILDNTNVVSSVEDNSRKDTEEIWKRLYPEEPYEFDLAGASSEDISEKLSGLEKCTKYDLISAVKRQTPFYYQVSRPHVENDIFLEGAVARYKGFLHLIKRNWEKSLRCFCVPTYDVDLIWHTHQLHPVAYCKDLQKALGKVLEHDDTDSDRTKGKKLDNGFSGTTKQWERTFGLRYWRAGAMYRGSGPAPLTKIPCLSRISKKTFPEDEYQKIVHLHKVNVVEVLLEVVGVKGLADEQKENLSVVFSKSQPDMFFHAKQKLSIPPELKEKQVRSFQCEPTGELLFELVSITPSNLKVTRAFKTLGTTSLSLKELLIPESKLAVEKWFVLTPCSRDECSEPISLRIAVSFTVPVQAPHEFQLVRPCPILRGSCFFPLAGRVQHSKSWTRVVDETQTEIISLQMREHMKGKEKDDCDSGKRVIGITKSGETHTLAELISTCWSLVSSQWSLKYNENAGADGHLFELVGNRMVCIYQGRKLEYEHGYREKERKENDFVTAVVFSTEYPYGKAVALLDLKSGYYQVKEDHLLLPLLVSAFILFDTMKKKGHIWMTVNEQSRKEGKTVNDNVIDQKEINITHSVENEKKLELQGLTSGVALTIEKGGSCGGNCGSGCGNMVRSGGFGGACGSGNMKNVVNGHGCSGCGGGGGCGSGCGNMMNANIGKGDMVRSGGCGGDCGSGCGSMMKLGDLGLVNVGKSSGCGGGCGSGCGGGGGSGSGCGSIMKSGDLGSGNGLKSGGCGGGCGSGCGDRPRNLVGSC